MHLKRNDLILIAFLLIIAAGGFIFHAIQDTPENGRAEIWVDGELWGTYSLDENIVVDIDGTNRLTIQDKKAYMTWADCPDQLCVRQKPASKDGESIICLPNKIVISIVGGEEDELDGVTN